MENKEYLEKIKTDDEFLSMSDLREKDNSRISGLPRF